MTNREQLEAVKALLATWLDIDSIAHQLRITRGRAQTLATVATLAPDLQERFANGQLPDSYIESVRRSKRRS